MGGGSPARPCSRRGWCGWAVVPRQSQVLESKDFRSAGWWGDFSWPRCLSEKQLGQCQHQKHREVEGV
eukprot:10940389-Alexandrium_andersonii.AAC.1